MTSICFTGWQQPTDALSCVAPADAQHFAYAEYDSVAECFAHLPKEVELAIGWSLGGQLLVRAIALKRLKAKRVILLGAPFQFLAGLLIPEGMPSDKMTAIIDNYRRQPQAMVEGFSALIAAGDAHAASITRTLRQSVHVWKNGMFWLKELGRFSCNDLTLSPFPPTTLLHGENDKVIYPAQARLFAERIFSARLHILPECGHAPHLHDEAAIREIVAQHV